ncbi:MAG TPA: hypothetical protein DCF71_10230, partial [Gemmatimonadetes bacterium]|nr:hypothetical protein [Gemmatimonadota bacterium]
LLRQVFRQCSVSHHSVDEREHRTLVPGEQLAERGLAATCSERGQLAIIDLCVVDVAQRIRVLPWVNEPGSGGSGR